MPTEPDPFEASFAMTPARSTMPDWYPTLLASITQRVAGGRTRAITAANLQLLTTYWAVGRDILDQQTAQGWGTKVIERLAADLRLEFPDTKGFSARNLKYMRAFAAAWAEDAIVQAPLAQLPWYHQIALLQKLDTPRTRLWYAAAAVENGWSRNILVHHIEGHLHDRSGMALTNFAATLPPADSDLAQQSTKDPYLFDFVGIADIRLERDLERALIQHVEQFLLELGSGFAFVGEQVRLTIGEHELRRPVVLPPHPAPLRRDRAQGGRVRSGIPGTTRDVHGRRRRPPRARRRQAHDRPPAVQDEEQRRGGIRPAGFGHAHRCRGVEDLHRNRLAR